MSRARKLTFGVTGIIVLLIAALAWVGVRALSAKNHLDAARVSLEAARTSLLDRKLDAAATAITDAGRETASARNLTGDPVWFVLAHIPYLGDNLAVARGIAVGADDIARRVLPPALQVARDLDPTLLRKPDGSVDLALLQRVAPPLRSADTVQDRVDREVHNLPTGLLVGPVVRAQASFADSVDKLTHALDGASGAVEVAPALLGSDKPRRYFALVQQTSESRGTGGLPGGFAILEASKGHISVTQQGSNADLYRGSVEPPPGVPLDYITRYGILGAFEDYRNVNVGPDLPVVARVVAARWKAQGGAPVDGVITLDATALADILRGSGPVDLGGGQLLPADQLEEYLAVGQYAAFADQTKRKDALGGVAAAAAARLTGAGGNSEQLLRGLVSALTTGHLHMASDDPALHPVLARTGVDDALPAGRAPVAYPVVFNATGGKLDHFLDRSIRYEAGPCSGNRRRSTITVTLTSTPPPLAKLPTYVTIRQVDGVQTQSIDNQVGLSVYATRGARLVSATLDGKALPTDFSQPTAVLQPGYEAGLPVWLTFVELPAGKARTLVLHLDEPTSHGRARVPAQALSRPLTTAIDVPTCS